MKENIKNLEAAKELVKKLFSKLFFSYEKKSKLLPNFEKKPLHD
jgi:hypothetical protein